MLTYLVVQQARTIDSQRGMIRVLLGDSLELSSLKGKAARAQAQSQPSAEIEPPAQAKPLPEAVKPKAGAARKDPPATRRQAPEKPSKNNGVVLDVRRVTFSL
jgi:hypothetical protein